MPQNNLFSNPDMVVALLVPNIQNESVSYKYLKELCKGFATKSTEPAEFVELIAAEWVMRPATLDGSLWLI